MMKKLVLAVIEEVLFLKREGDVEEALEVLSEAEEDKILQGPELNWALNLLV